jgi:hypothetical protein
VVWTPDNEDQSVRQYRYLLRTAPLDALEHAHVEVLGAMARSRRAEVLAGVQRGLVAGLRLGPDDVGKIAHLLTKGERRRPGDFLRACPQSALIPLAEGTIVAESSFGLFSGYAAWDGAEPAVDEGVDDSEFGQRWHNALVGPRVSYRSAVGGPSSPDTVFGRE